MFPPGIFPSLHQPTATEWCSQSFAGKKEKKGENKSLAEWERDPDPQIPSRGKKRKGVLCRPGMGETPVARSTMPHPPPCACYFY